MSMALVTSERKRRLARSEAAKKERQGDRGATKSAGTGRDMKALYHEGDYTAEITDEKGGNAGLEAEIGRAGRYLLAFLLSHRGGHR
jgi:hypothetical protein